MPTLARGSAVLDMANYLSSYRTALPKTEKTVAPSVFSPITHVQRFH